MDMRELRNILLIVGALVLIGCASADNGQSENSFSQRENKSVQLSPTEMERQKAIDWITINNQWGTSEKNGTAAIQNITQKIDRAIQEKKNIYIAIGKGILKSGKSSVIHWEENKFSVRGLSDTQVKGMRLDDMGINSGELTVN